MRARSGKRSLECSHTSQSLIDPEEDTTPFSRNRHHESCKYPTPGSQLNEGVLAKYAVVWSHVSLLSAKGKRMTICPSGLLPRLTGTGRWYQGMLARDIPASTLEGGVDFLALQGIRGAVLLLIRWTIGTPTSLSWANPR